MLRYTEELADFVLNGGPVNCDTSRLASKLKGEFCHVSWATRYFSRGGDVK